MIKTYVDYLSNDDFYYHHTLNTAPNSYLRNLESHNRIEILYLISGIVDYHINGAIFTIHPGDIIIVNAQELHTLHVKAGEPYERIVLHVSYSIIPTLKNLDLAFPFLNAHLFEHIIPKEIVDKTDIVRILKSITPLAQHHTKYSDVKIVSKIVDVIAEINQAVDTLLTNHYHLIPQPKSSNQLLQDIIKYINKNLDKNYSILEIAQLFNVSESYLHRFFKSHMNMSIYKYICNQKLQLALSLLNKGYTPQYVSDHLGYDYYTTFYTQFKKKFGKSPKAIATTV